MRVDLPWRDSGFIPDRPHFQAVGQRLQRRHVEHSQDHGSPHCRAIWACRLRHAPRQPADHAGRPRRGHTFQTRQRHFNSHDTLVILAFSGGGTRAAAASSAVPVVFSTVTLNSYGGTCHYEVPPRVGTLTQSTDTPRPAAPAIRELRESESYTDSAGRPYIHLVDGGVSGNVGMGGVLDARQLFETQHSAGLPTRLDHVGRIVLLIVNSLPSLPTNWDATVEGPGRWTCC